MEHIPKKWDDFTFEEIEKNLINHRQNLSQVESILEREKEKTIQLQNPNLNTQANINELIKLQKDLKNAINFQEDIKKFKLLTDPKTFNETHLDTKMHMGKICTAFYETENQWSTAIINEISENDKTVEVTWLGYKEKQVLPWKYIKVQETLNSEDLEVGMFCDAIYLEDGKWYQASIETISEHGVHVKYKKYDEVEVVSFESIRVTPEQKLLNQKRKDETIQKNEKSKFEAAEQAEFKLPDHLKVSPADNEQQRLIKRKRAKALKNSHKQKIIEKISKEKQDDWLNFSLKTNKLKTGQVPMKKIEKRP